MEDLLLINKYNMKVISLSILLILSFNSMILGQDNMLISGIITKAENDSIIVDNIISLKGDIKEKRTAFVIPGFLAGGIPVADESPNEKWIGKYVIIDVQYKSDLPYLYGKSVKSKYHPSLTPNGWNFFLFDTAVLNKYHIHDSPEVFIQNISEFIRKYSQVNVKNKPSFLENCIYGNTFYDFIKTYCLYELTGLYNDECWFEINGMMFFENIFINQKVSHYVKLHCLSILKKEFDYYNPEKELNYFKSILNSEDTNLHNYAKDKVSLLYKGTLNVIERIEENMKDYEGISLKSDEEIKNELIVPKLSDIFILGTIQSISKTIITLQVKNIYWNKTGKNINNTVEITYLKKELPEYLANILDISKDSLLTKEVLVNLKYIGNKYYLQNKNITSQGYLSYLTPDNQSICLLNNDYLENLNLITANTRQKNIEFRKKKMLEKIEDFSSTIQEKDLNKKLELLQSTVPDYYNFNFIRIMANQEIIKTEKDTCWCIMQKKRYMQSNLGFENYPLEIRLASAKYLSDNFNYRDSDILFRFYNQMITASDPYIKNQLSIIISNFLNDAHKRVHELNKINVEINEIIEKYN